MRALARLARDPNQDQSGQIMDQRHINARHRAQSTCEPALSVQFYTILSETLESTSPDFTHYPITAT